MKIFRRIIFFAILMISLSICIDVHAEEVSVSTFDEFKTALSNGGSIKLDGDITTISQLQPTKDATIDLNGHIITTSGGYILMRGADITIQDSAGGGKITNGGADNITIYVYADTSGTKGTLTLKSGTIESTNNKTTLYVNTGATFVMKDGKVLNTYNGYSLNVRAGGTAIIKDGLVRTSSGYCIMNLGNLTVESGEVRGAASAILNYDGSMTMIKGGLIRSGNARYSAIRTQAGSKTTISSGEITSPGNTIENSGELFIKGGKITSSSTANDKVAVHNGEGATATITGGEIVSSCIGLYNQKSQNDLPGGIVYFNGGTISTDNERGIYNAGELIVSSGKIYSSENTAVFNYTDAKMTVKGGEIKTDAKTTNEKAYDAIALFSNNELTIDGGTILAPKSYGISALNNSKIIINDGTVSSYYMALVGNGSDNGKGVSFEITGGTFISSSLAAYFPQINGNNKITGGTFIGLSAVEIRAGNLDITGGKFVATYDTLDVKPNGSGATTLGAAVAVAQHTTKQPIEVNISGGEFSGVASINLSNPQQNSEEDISKVKINVSGGAYSTKIKEDFIVDTYAQYEVYGNYKYLVAKKYNLDYQILAKDLEKYTDDVLRKIVTNQMVSNIDTDTKEAIKNAVNNNKKIAIQLQINEIANELLADDEINLFTSKIKGNQKIGSYFDIDVVVKADGVEIGKITELSSKIRVNIKILDELLNAKKGYTRKFSILRLHDGKVEKLNATLNNDNTLTFESNKFSLYAVVYEDVLDTKKESKNPQTGDNILFYILTFALSLFGFAVLWFYKKEYY